MKKALSMMIALAMVLTMVVAVAPAANAAETVLCEVENVAVTATTPYVWKWEATGDGIMHVEATPGYASGSVNAAFKVNIYADEAEYLANEQPSIMEMGSYQTPNDMWVDPLTDYEVSTGNYVVVELAAQKAYSNTSGNVSMTITFNDGSVAKEESAIAYGVTLGLGDNDLTLIDSAYHTLYLYTPDEIGVYTLSVSEGATIGYWGAGTFYFTNPNSTATSIEKEIKQVGQGMLVGIASDDPNVVLTIEKSGESGGIVEVVYINWENTHTPTKTLAGAGTKTLTAVNINEAHDAVLGEDGFYHLDSATGPVLYADMVSAGFSILSVYGLGGEGGEAATRLRGEYEGTHYEFLGAMREYATVLNNTDGIYPLTEDLLVFIKAYGDSQGWYKADLSSFDEIADGEFNEDTAWMVTLSYVEGSVAPHDCVKSEDYTEVYADDWSYWDEIYSCEICGEPMESVRWYFIIDEDDDTADVEFTTMIAPGETGNYFGSYNLAGTTLVAEAGDYTLTIDGVVQTPVEGFYIYEMSSYYGTDIQITNTGSVDGEYALYFLVPLGSMDNPDELVPGATDEIEFTADAEDGYYYIFTAPCDGKLSFTVGGESWQYYYFNDADWFYSDTFCYDDEEPVDTQVIELEAGQEIGLFVATMAPGDYWTIVEGTVTVTASFVHDGAVYVPEVPASETADGMEEHWYCADCDSYFTDAECTNEVEKDDLVITYIPETGDMNIAAVVVALMAATVGAVVLGKKKEF